MVKWYNLALIVLGQIVLCQANARCGKAAQEDRIVYGTPTKKGAHPWIVSMEMHDTRDDTWNHQCAGTLLDRQWILTAAHCFKITDDPARWRVVAGQYDTKIEECSEQLLQVEIILKHEDYMSGDHRHDVAMIRVQGKFRLGGQFVKPACLPSNSLVFPENTPCIIAGWGQHMYTVAREHWNKLLYYNSTIVSRDECRSEAQRVATEHKMVIGDVTDEMICIKSEYDASKPYQERGTGGVCGGDSGGPLLCKHQGSYYIAGIVSWSLQRPCGYTHDVFTRLHVYIDWVKGNRKLKSRDNRPPISPAC